MDIKRIVVGPVETNCYLLILNNELAVIDPADEPGKIISEIENTLLCHSRHSTLRPEPHRSDSKSVGGNPGLRIIPKYILLTHGHFDHVLAVNQLKEKYGFEVAIGEKDKDITDLNLQIRVQVPEIKPDILVSADGRTLCIGKETIQVIETPGHTIGSVSYLVGDNLFSGDTLFQNSHGRTDLPGGSDIDMRKSLGKLLKLDKGIKVYPGHGPETTIQEERKYNAYKK